MSLIKSGFPTSPRRSIWLNGVSEFGGGSIVFFDAQTAAITLDSTDYGLYVNSSGSLIYWNGTSSTTLGGSGGGGIPTWEALFTADATFTITPDTTFTIAGNRSTATDVLTLTNAAGGSGSVLQFTNSGSGNDVDGTSDTWSVSKAGAATFLTLTLSGTTITSTAADVAWALEDNDATALSIGAAGETDMMVFDTRTGAETVTFNNNLNVVNGAATFAAASNSVLAFKVTNNTATTLGAATNNTGVAVITSTSITTGSLLQLNLADDQLAGGFYLTCRETVGGTNDFTIGENGVVVMTGTAASDSLTVTNGHVVVSAGNFTMSDGVLALTSTGTADVFSVTANSLLANNALIVKGSGAFTGTAANSFVAITPTGLSTGTALYIAAAAATTASVLADFTTSTTTGSVLRLTATGVQLDGADTGVLTMVADSATTVGATDGRGAVSLSLDALTTGTGIDVTSTSITFTTGELLNVSHKSGNITGTLNCTSAGLVHVDATRTVTTGTVADDYDLSSFVRTDVINGGGTFSKAGSVLYVQNVTTNTSGTITDTVNGIEVVMDADGTGDAVKITHAATTGKSLNVVASATTGTVALITADSLTTSGVGLSIASAGTGVTSGSLLRVSTGTTGAVATNGIVSVRATGAFTSTSNVGIVDVLASAVTGAGTVMRVKSSAAGQTAVEVMRVEAAGYTTGYSGVVMNVVGVATTGAAATTHSVLTVTGANTTGGNIVQLSNNALTTGVGFLYAHTTSVIADGGSMMRLSSTGINTGGATNGAILDISSTASTSGTLVKITDTALTTGSALTIAHSTGVYTGTGVVNISAANTTGVAVLITASSMTTGKALSVVSASSDTGAFSVGEFKVTNAAATAAAPLKTSNVAVNNSKFTKVLAHTDGTKTVTIWMSQDATTPNGTLSGTAGDICLNGPSNRTFYCTGTTNWTASNA